MQTASLDLSKILVATDLSDQSGLAITKPNSSPTCGCGQSFS